MPPHSPPSAPKPYIDSGGTRAQSPVCPRRQRSQVPHEIWKGTTTCCPASKPSGPSTTSATHSCPRWIGS